MQLFAELALVGESWSPDVVIDIDRTGTIAAVHVDAGKCPPDATRVAGPLIPGMPNVHSHAFQRVFAGRTERRHTKGDDFWTWRDVMYRLANRLTPDQCEAVATHLYVEMLKAGYTVVAEFHYLHHAPDGRPFQNIAEMSERIIQAAGSAGIAITHLPVLYAFGGFGGQPAGAEQRRFVTTIEQYAKLFEALHSAYRSDAAVNIGMAPHSLRAVDAPLLSQALAHRMALSPRAPVHIHIAEQRREVDESVMHTGQRPVDWLCENMDIDDRWCLVHATHVNERELDQIVRHDAVVGLCPVTEANLGDGVFPCVGLLDRGGRYGIGSDSNILLNPFEELRLLEYGQRLTERRRARLASAGRESVGVSLYLDALTGGARALGRQCGAVAPGNHADLVVLDPEWLSLFAGSDAFLLDSLVFATPHNPVRDVMVGGQWVIVDGHHPEEQEISQRFIAARAALLDELND